MLGDIQFREDDNALVMGFLEVIDFKGVGPGHIFHFNAVLVKKIAVLGDKALPYRPKGFHFVNVNSSCEKIMSVAKNMMSDKIKKRVSGKLLQIVYAHIVYIILNNILQFIYINSFTCIRISNPSTNIYRKSVYRSNMVAAMAHLRMASKIGKINYLAIRNILKKKSNMARMKNYDEAVQLTPIRFSA